MVAVDTTGLVSKMGPNWAVCASADEGFALVKMAVLPSSGDAAELPHCFTGRVLPRRAGQEVALDLGAPTATCWHLFPPPSFFFKGTLRRI